MEGLGERNTSETAPPKISEVPQQRAGNRNRGSVWSKMPDMNGAERLDFLLGPRLQSLGGILDQLDYRRLRRIGVQLRDIPAPGEDWDFPVASLQGWIESYAAAVETIRITQESGLLSIMKDTSEEIRELLSTAIIPALDAQIVEPKNIDELIAYAKEHDRFKDFDFERFSGSAPSREEIARVIVVPLNVSVTWGERPKVDKSVGAKRLQIGALIGKAAVGGALAVGNLSLGVLGGLSILPAIQPTNVPIAVGIVGSAYTGLAAAFDAVEKIGAVIRG